MENACVHADGFLALEGFFGTVGQLQFSSNSTSEKTPLNRSVSGWPSSNLPVSLALSDPCQAGNDANKAIGASRKMARQLPMTQKSVAFYSKADAPQANFKFRFKEAGVQRRLACFSGHFEAHIFAPLLSVPRPFRSETEESVFLKQPRFS